jgi:pimeloyl-ACP methyl ester carboxylesterase
MLLPTDRGALFAYSGGKPFDAAKPCVVLIHGAQHDHSVWILQSRYLAHHGFAVLALDLPGHGASTAPLPGDVASIAETVATALAPLPSPRFLITGHSLGSLIALEVALRLSARVAGLALLACAAPMRVSEALLRATREAPSEAMDMINAWSHRAGLAAFAPRPGNPGPGFSIVWQNLRLMQRIAARNGAAVLPTDFAACNAYDGAPTAARSLHCPVLFVLGAADQMTPPKAARALLDACSDKTVLTLADTGHAMMAENPDAVRRALAEFAQRVLVRA